MQPREEARCPALKKSKTVCSQRLAADGFFYVFLRTGAAGRALTVGVCCACAGASAQKIKGSIMGVENIMMSNALRPIRATIVRRRLCKESFIVANSLEHCK